MIVTPRCFDRKCIHYLGVRQPDETELSEHVVCRAFPNGIPNEIAYGDNDHTSSFPGDHGILFKRQNDVR